jgi:hypothetical protein
MQLTLMQSHENSLAIIKTEIARLVLPSIRLARFFAQDVIFAPSIRKFDFSLGRKNRLIPHFNHEKRGNLIVY